MVDHGHRRLGVGFNVSPCQGNRFPPYTVSNEGTQFILKSEKSAFNKLVEKIEDMIAHPNDQVFRAVRPVYERGRRVQETDPDLLSRFGAYKVEEIKVRHGDPDYQRIYESELRQFIQRLQSNARNIAFYTAAVRIWTPNNTIKAEDIYNAVREADKPHHPLLLARVNPRRKPRRPRSRR